jgi:DNA replication initiation complex subunit (GINS family)
MITYNDLYEALRKERYSEQLQQLPKNFIFECSSYFKDKKDFSSKEDDLFLDLAAKNKKKLENAAAIFKELLVRRRKKILALAFVASETGISKKDFENMLDFEREMFESIVKTLEKTDKGLNDSINGTKEIKTTKLARFLEDVPEFLNLNGESVGPFEKGEVANLSKEIADILSKDKRVELIEDD